LKSERKSHTLEKKDLNDYNTYKKISEKLRKEKEMIE